LVFEINVPEKLLITVALVVVASLAGAQEVNETGELPSLEEIDRQLFKSPFIK
jgi:hypothetical protein